jgi:hypothetical protein
MPFRKKRTSPQPLSFGKEEGSERTSPRPSPFGRRGCRVFEAGEVLRRVRFSGDVFIEVSK